MGCFEAPPLSPQPQHSRPSFRWVPFKGPYFRRVPFKRSYFRRVCFSVCVYNAPPPPLQELREHRLRVPGILKRFKAWCFLFQPSWLKASGETQPYIGLLSPRPPPRAERELHLRRSAWSRSIKPWGEGHFVIPRRGETGRWGLFYGIVQEKLLMYDSLPRFLPGRGVIHRSFSTYGSFGCHFDRTHLGGGV